MITGSLDISGSSSLARVDICNSNGNNGLTFYPVQGDYFTGGYYLHDRLPLTRNDIFFHDGQADLLILFSGYIYNRAELARLYGIAGDEPEPVIASRMFLAEGPDFVRKLNGDFAIFILQPDIHRAYLFRDQIGVRPIAWLTNGKKLIFSTDIIGLSRTISDGCLPERDFLLGYFKYIDYSGTPNRMVRRLKPGHYLTFSESGAKLTCYWKPGKIRTDRKLSYTQMVSDLKGLLIDSVAIRCDRRFNAGAHVSSGLDSGIIAMLARNEYPAQKTFYGFSWSPPDLNPGQIRYDERDLVRKLCKKADIEALFCDLPTGEFLRKVTGFRRNNGHFFEDNLTDKAKLVGTGLIFSGWGGDEFLSTGDRGIETDLLRHLNLKTYFRRNPLRPLKRFIRYFLQYTLFPALGILQFSVSKSFEKDARYIKKPYKKSDRQALRNFYFHTSRREMHLRYLRFYHLQERCESWMMTGYTKGIEYRYPMLDKRIIEYMLKVPSLLLCRNDYFRPLLRLIGEGILPDEIRLNTSKKDPVYSIHWYALLRDSADILFTEVDQWQTNRALDFIDFDLLINDVEKYRNNHDSIDDKVLFKALIYIKAIHEFSKWYCEK